MKRLTLLALAASIAACDAASTPVGGGTAVDGTEYVVSQVHNTEYTVAAGVEETEVLHFDLVSKGSAPNEVLQSTFHITITPDGDVSTCQDNFKLQCQQ